MDEIIEEQYEERKERPAFLTVLLVLSSIYIVWSLFGTLTGVTGEKPTVEKEDVLSAEYYESMEKLSEQEGGEEAAAMLDGILNHLFYLSTDGYYSSLILNFIALLIGVVAVVMLFKMKKLGFHLYVIYSVVSVFGLYIIMPAAIVSGIVIFFSALVSGIMVLLYAINFKHLK